MEVFLISYLDIYLRRVGFLGSNIKDISINQGIRDFEKYLNESPNSLVLSVEDNNFNGIILDNKQDENRVTQKLLVELTTEITVGNILYCEELDIRWIIYLEKLEISPSYKTFYITKCNHILKWVDTEGAINESYCHLVSSKDSKIKENFRVWNGLITPQPNKVAEIVLPKISDLEKYTNLIIDEEGWYVIETDIVSVNGVMYATLGEQKVNFINDDLENKIANSDKINEYEVEIPTLQLQYQSSETISPIFIAYKNKRVTEDVSFTTSGVLLYNQVTKTFSARGNGNGSIIIKNGPVSKTQSVLITNTPEKNSMLIKGDKVLKLDREMDCEILGYTSLNVPTITLSNDILSLVSSSGMSFKIKANNKNKLGTCIISISDGVNSTAKEIEVVPLW